MKTCNNCDIKIDTLSSRCPVCGSVLIGKTKTSTYPKVKKKYASFLKVLLFLVLASDFICGYIDFQAFGGITWGKYVFFGTAAFYIVIRNVLKSHREAMGVLTRYGFVLVFLLLILFWLTKSYVVTDYVIPILCIVELVLSTFYALINKNKFTKKYLNVIVTNMLVAFIPLILMVFNLTTVNTLAGISFVGSLVLMVALIIFDFEGLKDELSKIFNY